MNTFPIHYLTSSAAFFLRENTDTFLTPQMKKVAGIAVGIFAALALLYLISRCCQVTAKIETRDYPDGSKFEGIFDEYNGRFIKGKKTDFEDNIEEGTFNYHNKLEGKGTITFVDGSVWNGEFVDGQLWGKGMKLHADGTIEEGIFSDNLLHGKGTIKHKNGTIIEGFFSNGKLHGYGKITKQDGTVEEGLFDKGNLTKSKAKREPKITVVPQPTVTLIKV